MSVGAWVATAFLTAAPTLGLVTAAVVGWAVAIGTTIAITAGLTELSKMLGPKPKKMPANTGEYGGTIEPRRIIYGQQRVGGMNVIPPVSTGQEGVYLHQVLAVAGHEVNAIPSVFFDQTEITNSQINAVTNTLNSGLVNGGDYADNAWIRRMLGTSTQIADLILDEALLTAWGTNHRGRGVAYVAIQYRYQPKGVYKYGKPDVSFIVQGKKVYDPRLDSTNGGSGSHRYTDSTTWEYSTNPALCLADYLMDANLGMGEAATRIDWTTVAAAANECDEVVTIPSSTQSRYTCNIVLDVTDRYEDNIEALCACMLGHCYYSSGKWQIHAGVWPAASAFSLSDDDLVGNVVVQTDSPRNEKYNAVRGQYYDPNREYQPSEFQPRTNATYESNDGERIWREIALRGCTNEYEAQRAAIIALRRSRNTQVVTADFGMSAFKVKPYEVGTLTISEIGWTNQNVRCIAWEFRPEGAVRLTLRKESSSDWTDPSVGDYTTAGSYSAPGSSDYSPPNPINLTATAVTGGTLLEWTISPLAPGAFIEIWRSTGTDYYGATRIATTYDSRYVDLLTSPTTYYYWVTAVSSDGVRSAATGPTVGAYRWMDAGPSTGSPITVLGTGGAGTVSVSISGGALVVNITPISISTYVADGTNVLVTTVSAVVSGGTSPYTYAWTDTMSGITLQSPTSSSTQVLATGTAKYHSGTISVTVTDSAGSPATDDDTINCEVYQGFPP